ncbi:TRAP transporter TatT component family protein [Thermodesulfobacteriota bacterium]
MVSSFFEECDPELAKNAMPSNLKLMEGLLKNDSENAQILTMLAMGFNGYSLLFVEDDDPQRASNLYLRAREYGIRALGSKARFLNNPDLIEKDLKVSLDIFDKKDVEPLFWVVFAWNAWINLNLDNPSALAQLTPSQACLEKVLELDATYFHGLPSILMGVSLSARPAMFGGNLEKAQDYFEKALQQSQGKFFAASYYYARYYGVRAQDKKLFLKLLQQVIEGTPADLPDSCLMNTVMRSKAQKFIENTDEFFF